MKFFRRKPSAIVLSIPLVEHLHTFLSDTGLPNAHRHLSPDKVPMSPDVLDHEEQASEERLKNVQTLIPLLAAHSLASSGAMVAEHLESLSPEERERVMEFAVASQASLSEVILRSTAASISQLLGLGLLVLGTPTAVLKTEKGKK